MLKKVGMTKNRQDRMMDSPKINKEDTLLYYIPGYANLTRSDYQYMNPFLDKFWSKCYKQYAEKYSILNTLKLSHKYIHI
jgi:hypothetical protein